MVIYIEKQGGLSLRQVDRQAMDRPKYIYVVSQKDIHVGIMYLNLLPQSILICNGEYIGGDAKFHFQQNGAPV